jgi:N-acyl-D-amino-acid deacylase
MNLDFALVGGDVIDGTGAPARRENVGIYAGEIAALGNFEVGKDTPVIDARGLIIAPGFIDIHSHSDYTLLVDSRAVSSLTQGVTLEVVGNCGYGCAPILNAALAPMSVYGALKGPPLAVCSTADYLTRLEAAKPAVNVMTLVPNGQLRLGHVGVTEKPATAEQLVRMKNTLARSLEEGAVGYSTGLQYAQEIGATAAEITELCRVTAAVDGLYATHTRDRDAHAVEAIAEAIDAARDSGVRLQVSHITPRTGLAVTEEAIRLVERARESGLDVAFDMHTRTFGFTHLKNVIPPWAHEGPPAKILERLRDPTMRAKFRRHPNLIAGVGDWERILLTSSGKLQKMNGLSFAEIGRQWNLHPHDAAFKVLEVEFETLHEPMVILKTYDEEVLAATYRHPLCMIGSDATALALDGPLAGEVFHGAYTWASWFWRRMVRELRVVSREEAIHRLTGLPARTMRLADRGELRVGARADVAVFDPQAFGETATIDQPNRLAVGMRHVFVNGVHSLADGKLTGARAGEVIRARR